MSCGIVIKPITFPLIKKPQISLSWLTLLIMVLGERWLEVITIKQSKQSLSELVLYYFDFKHQYLYQLLINCI